MWHYALEASILVVCLVNMILGRVNHVQATTTPKSLYGPIR